MLRALRSISLLAVLTAVAGAQGGKASPLPPVAPVPPARPSARPAPLPLERLRLGDLNLDLSGLRDLQSLEADARRLALEASRDAREASRDAARQAVEASREALAGLRVRGVLDLDRLGGELDGALMGGRLSGGPRYQNDPADSLYRQALQLLNSSDYRAAALRFKDVQQKFPNTQYLASAMYYQAFALYRAGSDAELREALAILEQHRQRFPNARVSGESNSPADAPALATRIRGTLAIRGDAAARQQLNQAASAGVQSCDREDQSVRSEALSALMRVDPAAAMPKLEQVLAKRDECSTPLRSYALQILTRRGDDKAVATLLATAKQDPSPKIRSDAVGFVARFPSEEVLSTLETLARNEQNEMVRRAAARNLVGYPSPRALQVVRSLVEDNSISDDIRTEMLDRYNEDRGTAEDAAWLRASFAKVTSPQVKRSIVGAVGRIGGADSQKWLMDMSSNDQESASIRSEAFRRVSRTMTVQDLVRAYDAAGSRPMRSSIVSALNARKEPEAVDKLIDIARKGTDPEIRRQVIGMLTDRKDPRITALLIELIDR